MSDDGSRINNQARALAEANRILEQRANEYLALIGDTPELSDDGRVIVRDERGNEIARLQLPRRE